MQKLLKLNIGCGTHKRFASDEGWLFCDLYPGPTVDKVFDCTKEWPFPDNSVGEIRCNHVLEHLDNFRGFFKEAHRVLIPNGRLHITVPYGLSNAGFADVTHIKYWVPGSFTFLQPNYGPHVFNPQHDSWNAFFEVEICLLRVAAGMRWFVNGPWRRWGLKALNYLLNSYCEVSVILRALKTEQDILAFSALRAGNAMPVHTVMHKTEYEGKPYTGGPVELVFLDANMVGFIRIGDLEDQLRFQQEVDQHNERLKND